MKIKMGDEAAFRLLFDSYFKFVYDQAFYLTKEKSAAEDVTQETFLKIWANRQKIDEVINFKAYLKVIVRNQIFNRLRKQAYQENFILETQALNETDFSNLPDSLVFNELVEKIDEVVAKLPHQQRRVYELRFSEDLSIKDIAYQLNISKETVKKHLARAKQTLKSNLSKYYPGTGNSLLLFLLVDISFSENME